MDKSQQTNANQMQRKYETWPEDAAIELLITDSR